MQTRKTNGGFYYDFGDFWRLNLNSPQKLNKNRFRGGKISENKKHTIKQTQIRRKRTRDQPETDFSSKEEVNEYNDPFAGIRTNIPS